MKKKHIFNKSHSVITFAANKWSYVQFAFNCAQSILLWNDINIYIVSDLTFPLPRHFNNRLFIIPAKPGHAGLGIGMKLYIDEYLQTEHSLFIDSDCLCYGRLNEIFDHCKDMDVSVVGNMVPSEGWVGDKFAASIISNYGLDKLIRYNGGLYYLKKTGLTKIIFDKAREIGESHDYGFDRIKNKWVNEEALLSIAMTLNNQTPVPDNGQFMTDLYTDHRPAKLNVLKGVRFLRNPAPPSRFHRPWYPDSYSPSVLHFGGNNIGSYPYKSQSMLLKFYSKGAPQWLATLLVSVFIDFPYKSFHSLVKTVRKFKK